MLERIFKRGGTRPEAEDDPRLRQLKQFRLRSAVCAVVRRDGGKVREDVGPVTFCRRNNRLLTRDRALFMVPPEGPGDTGSPFAGRGEVVNLRFYHRRIPYSMDCEVVRLVRFSDRLQTGMDPRVPVAYKLSPLGDVTKDETRGSLRFAHIRGATGPQSFPNLRLDLFVEKIQSSGPAHERAPSVVPYPGDTPVPQDLRDSESPDDLVRHFRRTLRTNPEALQRVHVSRAVRDHRSGSSRLVDLGYSDVLGLKGETTGLRVHLRYPRGSEREGSRSDDPREGDAVVLRYVGRGHLDGGDTYYRWPCRIFRRGVETLVLRPNGPIHTQTGLRTVVRDFSVGGLSIQSNPLLETYLLGEAAVPDDPEEVVRMLTGVGLLLRLHPRLYFTNDLERYAPQVPAAFSLLGKVVRGHVEERNVGGKPAAHVRDLGVRFTHDPADYCPETLATTAWEPLRPLRENGHFKEIHRALNAMIAFLEK